MCLPASFLLIMALFLLPVSAQCWWENGHRTTARLAAQFLTPETRVHVAAILSVPQDVESVADAMAQASTWPDEIKKDRPDTAVWHYIDLALQDDKTQIPERCANDNCVTARIELFSAQLIKDKTAADPTADLEALRFLIHFVGDVHQPLHASSNADLGGNCEALSEPYEKARNLHALWDGPMVDDINADDRLLAADLKKDLDSLSPHSRRKMAAGNADAWAWESHRLAARLIYKRLAVPTEPVEFPAGCNAAPQEILDFKIALDPAYVDAMKPIVRLQLERGGLRLARVLNDL